MAAEPTPADEAAGAADVPDGLERMLDAQANVCIEIEAALRDASEPHSAERAVLLRLYRSHRAAYRRLYESLSAEQQHRAQARSPARSRPKPCAPHTNSAAAA
jgi:ABC-type ATPase with predicted acetyltransferase domain